jgi:glycosyltransferase involved in cell wall biosynthesis
VIAFTQSNLLQLDHCYIGLILTQSNLRDMGNTILLVMPVPFQAQAGALCFDQQTCQGLARWAEHFEQVIMACPLQPPGLNSNASLEGLQAIQDLPCADQITLVPLPWAYDVISFIKAYRDTRQILARWVSEADYICVSPSTLEGDWPAIAALEAMRQKRPYAVWIDRVEYDIDWRTRHRQRWYKQLSFYITVPLTKLYQHFIVRRAALGLFQGQETFNVFKSVCRESHCVYDVHTTRADQISPEQLQAKLSSLQNGPLRIVYMGRAAEMKGPLDWVKAIHRICQAGVDVEATWLGHGPLWDEMKALVDELDLAERIALPGFVSDHGQVVAAMRQGHLLMFCHKTPESPRCLVESLVVATPIVGYGSDYPEGLVTPHGGGEFVEIHQWKQLADRVIALAQDRAALAHLVEAAARSGQQFSEEDVFEHRSSLLYQHLTRPDKATVPIPVDTAPAASY